MATVVLYAVDLEEMRRWVGSGEEALLGEGLAILGEDEEADWEPEELALLERLLRRMVFDGQLYEGLPEEERYYLTQLLVDLFDEVVESEAVSEELPLATLESALAPLREEGGLAARMAGWLTRGRLFGSDALAWDGRGEIDEVLPYFGTLAREELPALIEALERLAPAERPASAPPGRRRRAGSGGGSQGAVFGQLLTAARAALETERDLLAFVG